MLLPSRLKILKQPMFTFGFVGYFFVPSISIIIHPEKGYSAIFGFCGIVFAIWMLLTQSQIAIRTRACYPLLPSKSQSLLGDTLATIGLGLLCSGIAYTFDVKGAPLPLLYASLFNLAWLLTQARSSRPKFVTSGFHLAIVFALLASAPLKKQLIDFSDQLGPSALVAAVLLPIGFTLVLDPLVIKNWRQLHRRGMPSVFSFNTERAVRMMHARKRKSPARSFLSQPSGFSQQFRNALWASTSIGWTMCRPMRAVAIYCLAFPVAYLAFFFTSAATSKIPLLEAYRTFSTIGFIAIAIPQIAMASFQAAELKVFITRLGRAACFRFAHSLLLRTGLCLCLALLITFPLLKLGVAWKANIAFTLYDLHPPLLACALTLALLVPIGLWQFSVLKLGQAQVAPFSLARIGSILLSVIPLAVWFGFSTMAFALGAEEHPERIPLHIVIEAAALLLISAFSWLWLVPRSRKHFLKRDL